jgi:hypothetical protein
MKKLFFTFVMLAVTVSTFAHHKGKKELHKIDAVVVNEKGGFVLKPDNFKDHKIKTLDLPVEYMKEGLHVTVVGTMGKCKMKVIEMNVHSISVKPEDFKSFTFKHSEYNFQQYAIAASAF